MPKIILLISLLTLSKYAAGQQVTINGFVYDHSTGEALIGALLFESNEHIGIMTNQYGYFSIKTPKVKLSLKVSYLGYQSQQISFITEKDTMFNVRLLPSNNTLEEVSVKGITEGNQLLKPIGAINIPIERLKIVPTLMGESDIMKALAMTPGVSVANEGTTGLLVRGGTPDQNLIILDEATIYNVSHLFGIVSVFNPDALKNVELYKSGFPARYGGRLSSILDINMKEGNNKKQASEGGIGLLNSRFLTEGPLFQKTKNQSSYIISARASYLSLMLLPTKLAFEAGKSDSYFNYLMYNFNAKINHQFKDGSKIFVSVYNGYDFWSAWSKSTSLDASRFGLTWGNTTATARYHRSLSPSLFLKSILTYSKFRYKIESSDYHVENNKRTLNSIYTNQSTVEDITIKASLEYAPTLFHSLLGGIDITQHTYLPTAVNSNLEINADTLKRFNTPLKATEIAFYFEDNIKINKWARLNIGLRHNLFNVQQQTFSAFEPRVSMNILLSNTLAIKLGYSRMNQFIHLLSGNNLGLPNDIWVPATRLVPPSNSNQWAMGISKNFNKWELSLEGYYKDMSHLIEYRDGTSFFGGYTQYWENRVIKNGVGQSYGLEFFLNKTKGKFTGWLAYTLAWNYRKFEEINDGNWFRASFDRRHSLSITGSYSIKNHLGMAANFQYLSGQVATVPVAIQPNKDAYYPNFTLIYHDRNNFQLPDYHRLDLSMYFKHITKRKREATWTIGIYNAYNQHNAFFTSIKWKTIELPTQKLNTPSSGLKTYLVQNSIFPILPYFNYSIKF